MSVTHTITRAVNDGGATLSKAEAVAVGEAVNFDQSVATGVTDGVYAFAFIAAKLKSFYITSDKAVTVKTYNGVTLHETITLVAGQAIQWTLLDASLLPLPFAADVQSIKITNASGATALVQIRAAVDPS